VSRILLTGIVGKRLLRRSARLARPFHSAHSVSQELEAVVELLDVGEHAHGHMVLTAGWGPCNAARAPVLNARSSEVSLGRTDHHRGCSFCKLTPALRRREKVVPIGHGNFGAIASARRGSTGLSR
jgi:hypothetical protein